MERQLFSGESRCTSECAYCFAKWQNYSRQPFLDIKHVTKNELIIYPCCDSELCINSSMISTLQSIAEQMKKVYISISTKNLITDCQISQLKDLNKKLLKLKKGFVKISISISSKKLLHDIEPKTLDYEKRKQLLTSLKKDGFKTSVIIKPMLPFVPLEEYYEIVDDFKFCNYFLIGDLYVNSETTFFKEYIENKYPTEQRKVGWLFNQPVWNYVLQDERKNKLKTYINSNNLKCFESDIDVIAEMSSKEN